MAKKIKNPLAFVVVKTDDTYQCRADYGVVCEHGLEDRRSMEITLKPQTMNDIDEEAMEQIHAHEGTSELVNGDE